MDGNEPDDRSPFIWSGGPFTWFPNPPQGDNVRAYMDLARIREGGHVIEDDLENLRQYHKLGVRCMTLTHNYSLDWADSATDEPVANGLSEFGMQVVKEMNRLGIIVDVSHVSDQTFWDVIETSEAPIIASHSNARALADIARNMTDDMIRAVGRKNGVVGINFMVNYLDPDKTSMYKTGSGWHWFWHPRHPETPMSKVVDHINHVSISSDFDGSPFLPEDLQDVGEFPNLTVELLRRGYSDEDIRNILGDNLLRVLADVERVAARLSREIGS
jgi:membrane dipeptidase